MHIVNAAGAARGVRDVLRRAHTPLDGKRFGGISTVLSFGQRRAEERRYSDVIEASYGYARRVAIYKGAFWGSSYLVGGPTKDQDSDDDDDDSMVGEGVGNIVICLAQALVL